jgi:NADH-quinone oxidoreductase subunit H
MFFLAEFMGTVVWSTVMVTLFFGGPSLVQLGPIEKISPVWFVAKTFVFLFSFVWLRATLPRMRYDQLMDLGWKKLIPVALFWLLVLAGMLIDAPTDDTGFLGNVMRRRYGFIIFLGGLALGAMLVRAMTIGRARADDDQPAPQLREVT